MLRAAWTTAAAATAALSLAAAASAHLNVQPRLLEQGRRTELTVELPRLRPGEGPAGLRVVGRGVTVHSTRLLERVGPETRWHVLLTAESPAGILPVELVVDYPGGASVAVAQQLTVLPPDRDGSTTWTAAVAAAGLVVLLSAVALWMLRRRRAGGRDPA